MKRFIILFLTFLSFSAYADKYPAGWLPDVPKTIVVDLADILTPDQQQKLEHRLVAFDDTTSNQIAVLITPSLGGDEIAHFAQQVFAKWRIGHKENNGVLIVLKPKTAIADGEVRIHTGYGLEGALPDGFCSNIIENDMIPHFRDGEDYYGGIVAALDVIEKVCVGEYSYEVRKQEEAMEERIGAIIFLVVFAIVMVVMLLVAVDQKKHPERYAVHASDAAGFIIGSSLGRSSGSWNSFSGGSGGFGGFGGFGGGFSGGGGASGRW